MRRRAGRGAACCSSRYCAGGRVILGIYAVIVGASCHALALQLRLTLKHYASTPRRYTPLSQLGWLRLTAVGGDVITFPGLPRREDRQRARRRALHALAAAGGGAGWCGLAYIFVFNAAGSVLNRLYGTLAILVISICPLLYGAVLNATTRSSRWTPSSRTSRPRWACRFTAFWRSACRSAALDRPHQHVLLPQRIGHAVGRRLLVGRAPSWPRCRAAAGRRRRDRRPRAMSDADHRPRPAHPARGTGRCCARSPAPTQAWTAR